MFLREIIRRLVYARVFFRMKAHGKNICLSMGGVIKRPEELELGDNVFISRNFHISAQSMRIGNNVMIGPNFLAECDNHVFDRVGVTMFSIKNSRNIAGITIEDDVWIGGNVTLLKGVTIAEGCVIGAGSIVTKCMPPYSICFGVPCHPIKPRFQAIQLKEHLEIINSKLSIEVVLAEWKRAGLQTESTLSAN